MSDRLTLAVLRFTANVERLNDPADILEALHQFARLAGLNAFGAWCLPAWARRDDRRAFSIHMHPSVPAAFLPEYWKLYRQHGRSFMQTLAWQNRGAFTMGEALRTIKPTGNDRWLQELAYRHGIRDVFYCPNGECMVVYWSPKPLRLDATTRAVLQLAASATAARLRALSSRRGQQEPDPGLSPRQRAVLRLVSQGLSLQETADHLGIAYGTVYEHAERAAEKLDAKSLPHTVAEALRRYVVIGIGTGIFAAHYAALAYAFSLGLDWPILMARALRLV
jgi:DNA-binding CsgD family transcriptional regulator